MDQMQIDQLLPMQLLNSLVFSVVVTDLEGRFVYVNPLFKYKFSHLGSDLTHKHFAETVFAEDVKLCNEAARECIRVPEKHITVTVRKAVDGNDYFWTQWEVSAYINELGKVTGLVSIGHDVTSTETIHNRTLALSEDIKTIHNEKFRSMVNHIPGVIYRCLGDEDLTIEFISDEVERLTGYSLNHFIHNKVDGYSSLIHEADLEMVRATKTSAVINKHHFELEYRILNANKEIRWVFERGHAVYDEADQQVYVDGCIFDITDRKKVEAALEKSEDEVKRLALVAHNTTNSVLIADKDQQIIWVNEGFTRISGYTIDEVKGKRIGFSLEGDRGDEKARKRLKHALDNKLAFKEEFYSQTKSGAYIWVEADCQPLFDEANEHIGFMAIENDVTRRKEAQIQQQELLQRLTLATDSAQIGIWEIDINDGNIIWDDKMFEIYGYEKNSSIPPYKIWKEAVHPEDIVMMESIIDELIEGKRDINSAMYRIKMPNGRTRYIESHAIVKKSAQGKVLRLIGTNRNVTDDVLVQEKLKTQNKILRDIAFIQSHEVRRPLANILGVIEVLNSSNAINNKEIFDHLIESANELDMQIRSIVRKTNNIDGFKTG
ncbi:MAG: PAS domain-containing protein [Chitinophagaceae bacterium]|nr:PAS domain-containing protein [Chitinophagaceae bacterium]